MKRTIQKYKGTIEWDEEDRIHIGRCPELFSGGVHGETKEEVSVKLDSVIKEVLEDYKKRKKQPLIASVRKSRTSGALKARVLANLNQKQFAEVLGVPVGTYRNWEQKRVEPKGPAKRLMKLIEKKPELIMELV